MKLTRKELIKKYIDFFKTKGHKHIPSSSLIPANDPTVLFTTAGMHPLVPYLLGQKHPLGNRLVSVQKCIRTGDIDEVGDTSHHTFFEMLGNWSLGDYFKEDAIKFSFEFLTSKKYLNILKEKISVTCFEGDKKLSIPKDEESSKIWQSQGIPSSKIKFLGKEDNWWGPAGNTGPCGPDTEMFYNGLEIWNDVFMEYNKDTKGNFTELKQKNVDTGMGVERTLRVLNELDDDYLTDTFLPIIKEIEKISGLSYSNLVSGTQKGGAGTNKDKVRAMRIIADHIKASVFILAEQIAPSNTEHGYVLRRLIRRAIRYGKKIGIEKNFTKNLSKKVLEIYSDYDEIHKNHKFISEQLETEENKFKETLEKGIKKFEELSQDKLISGKEAFLLFQSYGFPIEMTQELAEEKGIKIDLEEYNKEFKRHQDLSRTASAGTFKSGLADNSEATRKLHTATHLLNEALRRILGNEVKQKGSNINPERLRFDFNFSRKLTEEEKQKVENLVNEKINQGLKVHMTEIPLKQAQKESAQAEFGDKYPELVSVYTIEDKTEKTGWFSKEICTGPHVDNTKELGSFKILKEESSSAGVRRIKAIVE